MKSSTLFIVLFTLLFSACTKNELPPYNTSILAPITVEFDNIAGGSDLQLNTGTYSNAAGESFKVTKWKYYVSNFVFASVDGNIYKVPQDSCYFLIDESVPASHQPAFRIPEGEYKMMSFVLGVDSLRNTMDVSKRTGVLDPTGAASDMYWGWNSGYIFMKIEGTSNAIPAAGNAFQYHIGGFGGYNTATPNNLKTITLDLSARGTAKVKYGKSSNIHLFADVLKAFTGTTNTSFASLAAIHSAQPGIPIANNLTGAFKHDHTEN